MSNLIKGTFVPLDLGAYSQPVSLVIQTPKFPASRSRSSFAKGDCHHIASLGLDEGSVVQLAKLLPLRRDPFDQMLFCQALQQGLMIATVDTAIRAYSVNIIRQPSSLWINE